MGAATIAAGLAVHLGGGGLPPALRDITGDALWAAMMAWWVGACFPRRRPLPRAALAYAVCVAVELSQRIHTPTLDAVRGTTLGHLVLGSGFDPRDVAAYLAGVVLALIIERTIIGKNEHLSG